MDSFIRMRIQPSLVIQVKGQSSMLDRRVPFLADVPQRDLIGIRIRNRKTYCIPVAAWRKMRTGGCVTKIAEFPYLGV